MSETLTEFLLTRIAEDAAELDHARSHWMHGDDRFYRDEGYQQFNADDMRVMVGYGRARREIEAKRRIVERDALVSSDWTPAQADLGVIYADHRDYREEWKP